MTLALHHVTVDSSDALALATFWSAALGKPLDEGGDAEFAAIGGGASDGQGWLFFQVPEGKAAKNRMHVDLKSTDRAADVERLVDLGATIAHERDQWGTRWTVLQDPEGNEFCVVQLS